MSFVAAALLALILIGADHYRLSELLRRTADVTTLDAAQRSLQPVPGTRERSVVLLPGALDGKWFLIHTEKFLSGDAWRVRWSSLDNAPEGREVHWASLVPWMLAGWASSLAALEGGLALEKVSIAALSFGPVSLLVMLALLSWLVWRRFGPVPAALALLILSTACPFVDMFRTGQVDHHGLASVFSLAAVFCLGAGGAGVADRGARLEGWWYVIGGIFGGLALWVSAATALPVLAACGPGAVLGILCVAAGSRVVVWPRAFRLWAAAGAATSLAFYLLEYFPSHMGWRLEVNHPLYALAWLGGGWWLAWLVSFLARWRGLEVASAPAELGGWMAGAAATVALAAPVVSIFAFRSEVFVVSDPFLFALHQEYISEFRSAWASFAGPGLAEKLVDLYWWPLLFCILVGFLFVRRSVLPSLVWPPLVLAASVAFAAQLEALMQVRWGGLALSLWVAGVLLAAGFCWQHRSQIRLARWVRVALAAFILLGMLPAPIAALRGAIALEEEGGTPTPKNFVPALLLRDVSHRLIRVTSAQVPVVLSDPTSSSELAFYGGLKVIGALYWENLPGLLRAARIFTARSEEEARQHLAEAGINYVVLPTWDSFSELEAYSSLLARVGDVSREGPPYLARVLSGEEQPAWARPIHYPIPEAFGVEDVRVSIFEFVPGQTPFEAQRARGLYEFERGDLGAAIGHFEAALALNPGDTELPEWLTALRKKSGSEAARP